MQLSRWTDAIRRRLRPAKPRQNRNRSSLIIIDALESRVLLSAATFDSGTESQQTNIASASLVDLSLLSDSVWLSTEEVMQLPTTGTAWNTILAAASGSTGTPDLSSYDSNADVLTLAKALVGVRLGNEQYKAQVRTNVMAAMGTEAGGPQVNLSRGIAPYLISASLVGLSPEQDTTFKSWLQRKLTTDLHDPGFTIQGYHETRPNNHGLMAGASRAAIAVYLEDEQELARVAQVFKGWLGDRSSYAGFDYGDLSWQSDPNNPVGINPVGATIQGHDVDGVMPEELRRGASYRWPPTKTGYPWEGLQAAVVTAEILYRAGYDAWEWQDRALLRAVQWLYRNEFFPEGDDQWTPWIIDARYGTNFATNASAPPGKLMGWTAWTHQFAAAVPQISSISPTSGIVGTLVTLTGRNFTGVTDVFFNNTRSQNVSIISDTELRAVVPAVATTGPIRVVNAEGSTTSTTPFTLLVAPSITSFTPSSGPVGTEVTLNGSGFTGTTAILFNGISAAGFTVVSDIQLRATVATGTTTGTIQIVNPVNSATSAQSFTVTQPSPTQNFAAAHDSYVRSDSANGNFGAATTIRVRSSGPTYNGYLKFTASGLAGPVQSAKVRLFVTDGGPSAGSIYSVSNNLAGSTTAWTEANLTWSNAPPISGSALSTLGSVANGVWIEFDVSAAIAGNGTFSFAIRNTSTNSVYFGSAEGANPPQLVIQTGTSSGTLAISSFSPASGPVGTEVTINGSGFSSVNSVRFNGISAASFVIDSDTRLRAVVPTGATTGPIRVDTATANSVSSSNFDVTTSPPPSSPVTFIPIADAHVKSSSATSNYGNENIVRLRAGDPEYRGYLKFNVSGLTSPVQIAKIRLWVDDASDQGGTIYRTSNNYNGSATEWTESGLTWNNAPPIVGSALSTAGNAPTGAWIEFDVTAAIIGNGIFSFLMTTTSTNSLYYSSSEGGHPPELIVTPAS